VLEEIEVRTPRFVQRHNLAVNNRVVGKISQSFEDLRILSVEGIPPPRKKTEVTERFHGDCAISIEFDFFCGVRRYVALGNRFWLARHIDGPRRHIISYQRLRRNCISTASFFQCFARTAPRISHVASALAFISRSTSA
jgi:hypothetical protein